jgi:hypothetical protein
MYYKHGIVIWQMNLPDVGNVVNLVWYSSKLEGLVM